jgi:hypothetical protein
MKKLAREENLARSKTKVELVPRSKE